MSLKEPTEPIISEDSRARGIIFTLLFVIPIFAVLLYGSTDIGALIPLTLLVGLLAGTWIFLVWRSGIFELNANVVLVPILGILLLCVVQLLPFGNSGIPPSELSVPASNSLTLDPFSTRIFLVRLVGYIIFLAAAFTFIDTEERYRRAVSVLVIFGGLIAFVGILQKLASPEAIYGVRKHSGAIPFGPYVNSHHFASLMVLISGIGVAHLLGGGIQKQTKLLVGIAVGLMAIAVPFTSSRGGVLAYLAMLSVAGGAVLGMIVLASLLYLGGESSLLRGIGIDNQSPDISSGRFHFWSVAWKIFLANPVTGTGMDSFGVAFTQFDTKSGIFRVEQAHNDYLQMLADGGVIGFGLVAAFIFLLGRGAAKRLGEETAPFAVATVIGGLAGCVGIFVHSAFDFPLRTVGNAFVFLLVIGIVLAPVSFKKTHG